MTWSLALGVLLPLLSVLGEGLLAGGVEVLVEATDDALRDGLGPDGGERTEAAGGLDVALKTDDLDGRRLDDGDGVDDILLDGLLTLALLEVSSDVSHTGLVAHEGGQVHRLGLVVLRVGADGTLGVLRSALRQVTEMTLSRVLEFSMRHVDNK